jgi:hypothetical protein
MSYCTDCTLHGAEMRYGGAPGRHHFKPIFFELCFSHWNKKCWDFRLCELNMSSVSMIKSKHRSRTIVMNSVKQARWNVHYQIFSQLVFNWSVEKLPCFKQTFVGYWTGFSILRLANQCVRIKPIKQFKEFFCSQLRYHTITKYLHLAW